MQKVMHDLNVRMFRDNGYCPLGAIIDQELSQFLYAYARESAQRQRLAPGDPCVPGTPCSYSDPLMESLLGVLLPSMQLHTGLKLFPTYSYFRAYKHGDRLPRHKDRSSCEISVSLSAGYEAETPWRFWIERNGTAQGFDLKPGEAVLYKGSELVHWRDVFEGKYAVQIFLHFVDQNGPYCDWIYDKRPHLQANPEMSKILAAFVMK